MYKQKEPLGCVIVCLHNVSRKIDSFGGAGGHYSEFAARPCCRLSDFDKQIQEKHIHEGSNLSNLLTKHSSGL